MEPVNLTVRQLNMYVRSLLEGDVNLASITLVGEVSGFKNHYGSGHWYFVLKDADAAVRCVMFKGNALRVNFAVNDGMLVVCRGYVSLYEKDGQFQFYAESMKPFGEGDLAAEFERIKNKLKSEGLFDLDKKRPLPKFPKKIGVITSQTGAALQDILDILNRRYPLAQVVLFPALVQGSLAPNSLINALNRAYLRDDLDILIIGRGGGSAEDLSCFNDENLARKIADSPVPIISAVGHEVDFTICDFVSDLRAPTPSAAAEIAVPTVEEVTKEIGLIKDKIKHSVVKKLDFYKFQFDNLQSKRCFSKPELLFYPFEQKLDIVSERLVTAYTLFLKDCEVQLNKIQSALKTLSVDSVMERGFSAVFFGEKLLKSADEIKVGDTLDIRFSKGKAKVKVIDTNMEE